VPKADYATGPTEAITLTLIVEPAFSAEEIGDIVAGAHAWMAATIGVDIRVRIERCSNHLMLPGTVCVMPETGEVMEETWHCAPGISARVVGCHVRGMRRIMLDYSHLNHQERQLAAAHEIGHAFDLKHDAAGTVMARHLGIQTLPGCKDVAALWRAHGGVPGPCRLRGI
jgi:hypothetical protein